MTEKTTQKNVLWRIPNVFYRPWETFSSLKENGHKRNDFYFFSRKTRSFGSCGHLPSHPPECSIYHKPWLIANRKWQTDTSHRPQGLTSLLWEKLSRLKRNQAIKFSIVSYSEDPLVETAREGRGGGGVKTGSGEKKAMCSFLPSCVYFSCNAYS